MTKNYNLSLEEIESITKISSFLKLPVKEINTKNDNLEFRWIDNINSYEYYFRNDFKNSLEVYCSKYNIPSESYDIYTKEGYFFDNHGIAVIEFQ